MSPHGLHRAVLCAALLLAAAPVHAIPPAAPTKDGDGRSFAYLMMRKGTTNTRGSLHENDFAIADRVRRKYDADLLWVRFEDRSWVVTQPALLARVRAELEPEDRLEARKLPVRRRIEALDVEWRKIEAKERELDREESAWTARLEELESRLEAREKRGESKADLEGARATLKREGEALKARRAPLSNQREQITRQQQSAFTRERELIAEGEKVWRETLRRIATIARGAIESGAAEQVM